MAPDKIFLQVCGSCNLDVTCENCEFAKLLGGGGVTWSEDRICEKDEEYIRKDALLEWAKKEMKEWSSESNTAQGVKMGLTLVLDKIESL